jgi:outer membrane receptor protein involved in Fe transport
MSSNMTWRWKAALAASSALVAVASPAFAQTHAFDIAAQPAGAGVQAFARQADVQVLASEDVTRNLRTSAVKGQFAADEGLNRLLVGTGLEARQTGPGSYALVGSSSAEGPSAANPATSVDTVVITARAGVQQRTRASTSYSITVIPQEKLREEGVSSVADSLRKVPGFWVENSGGEASANVRARGIPVDGYASVQLEEDGLPIQHDPGLGYLNVDQSFRLDETIDQIQVVRGGPASIFAPNAPGGLVNYITRKPGDVASGLVKATVGDDGLYRADFWYGGPVGDWKVGVGGFYRTERGARDPGYNFNDGGQFRIKASHDIARGQIELDYKHIDDHVGFLPDTPFAATASGGVTGVAGLNPVTGILAGPETAKISVRNAQGLATFDATQGTAVKLDQFSAHLLQDIGDGWRLDDHFRLRSTDQQRIGLFPANVQTGAVRISQLNSQVLPLYPTAAALQLRYLDNGAAFTANQNGNGLEVDDAARQVSLTEREVIDDLRFSRQFHLGGQVHDVSFGGYFMNAHETFNRYSAVVMMDVQNHARLLNLLAVNAAGAVVATATENGVLRDGSEFADGRGEQTTFAAYASDEWSITDALRIDAGVRYESMNTSGSSQGTATVNLNQSPTVADDSYLTGNGVYTPYSRHFDTVTWTLGANYQIDPRQGVFARATGAQRGPSISDFITNPTNTPVINRTEMYELGYKYSRPFIDIFATLFDTEFHNYGVGETIYNAATQGFVSQTYYANTRDYGLELDGTLRPFDHTELAFTGTFQQPTFTSLRYTTLNGGVLTALDYNGKQLLRIPKVSLAVTPAIYLLNDNLRADLSVEYFSDRYADAANSQKLPAYTVLSASARYNFTPNLTLYLNAYNLTNAIGLTEGNPRSGELLSTQAGSPVFIARSIVGRTVKASILYRF